MNWKVSAVELMIPLLHMPLEKRPFKLSRTLTSESMQIAANNTIGIVLRPSDKSKFSLDEKLQK